MEGIKTRTIKWHPKNLKIAQIPKEGLEYALISDNYEQIHQLVWCKDFMQDVVHGHVNQSYTHIYGFKYDPKTDPPVSMKRTRLMVANWKDAELGEKLKDRVLPLLHSVEEKLGMSKTILEKGVKAPPRYAKSGLWILDSSIRWSKAPPMMSFFTMLLRIGLVYQPSDSLKEHIKKIKDGTVKGYFSIERAQDKGQVTRGQKAINRILKYGDRRLFHADIKKNYPPINATPKAGEKFVSIYTIHDGCGMCAYSNDSTKTFFPYWHRLDGGNK